MYTAFKARLFKAESIMIFLQRVNFGVSYQGRSLWSRPNVAALLTVSKESAYRGKEFHAYAKWISQVRREFLLVCIRLHVTKHSSLTQLVQRVDACTAALWNWAMKKRRFTYTTPKTSLPHTLKTTVISPTYAKDWTKIHVW